MAITDVKKLRDILELEINNSSNVFVVGHNKIDFDALGSALGLARLVKEYNKKVYIVMDDLDITLQSGIVSIMDLVKDDYKFIKKKDVEKLLSKKSLLLVTDVNKKNMISIGDMTDKFNSIVVIDHHSENENTIDTSNKFIDLEVSSASEVVARVLNSLKIKYDDNIANALFAGIYLDTKRFSWNASSKTYDTAEKLVNSGANADYVYSLFLENIDDFCKIVGMIKDNYIIKKYSDSDLTPIYVSFVLNRNNPQEIYLKEDIAKAADQMLSFRGIDAAFVMGYLDDGSIHISARGNKKVDVGNIMNEIGGGGNPQCAGCKIEEGDILKAEKILMKKIKYGISEDEKIKDEPTAVKLKNKKNS